jgi:uncharacterized membrane protein
MMDRNSESARENYLRRFRRGLAVLPADIREDLVQELRSHISERSGNPAFDLVNEFGLPEEYAARFVSEHVLSAAVTRGTSTQLIAALIGKLHATSRAVFLVLPLAVLQIAALMLIGMGILKPFSSGHVGLFVFPDGGFGGLGWIGDTAGMHEELGYAAVPLFIFGGVLLFWLGNRLLVQLARKELTVLREDLR